MAINRKGDLVALFEAITPALPFPYKYAVTQTNSFFARARLRPVKSEHHIWILFWRLSVED